MFEKVGVPIIGIVENMAMHTCSNCGHTEHIFGEGGGAIEAERLGVPLLAQIPLDIATRDRADRGEPIATLDPATNAISAAFAGLAEKMIAAVR